MADRDSHSLQSRPGIGRQGLESATPVLRVYRRSGNALSDVKLGNADDLDTKVRLAVAANHALDARRLTQRAAAEITAINPLKVVTVR